MKLWLSICRSAKKGRRFLKIESSAVSWLCEWYLRNGEYGERSMRLVERYAIYGSSYWMDVAMI